MSAAPAKSKGQVMFGSCRTFPALSSTKPIAIFKSPHSTFVTGDDNHFPGGFAKGVGNLSPQIP